MFVDDLVVYLDANSTQLTAGTNLFKHSMPDTTGRGVFLYETVGRQADDKFSLGLPALVRPRASITIRSTGSAGGDGIAGSTATADLANNVWDLLSNVADTTINGVYYQLISPLQSAPAFLRHDEKGRANFVLNVEAIRTPTTQA